MEKLSRLYKKLPYPCHCIRKFVDKTFAVEGNTAKSMNVLSLKCLVLYGRPEQVTILNTSQHEVAFQSFYKCVVYLAFTPFAAMVLLLLAINRVVL